jgi:fructose-specific component phosphotransferase system IIB-like protein
MEHNTAAHNQALAIFEAAADAGGDLDILCGASIYADIRFNGSDEDMAEYEAVYADRMEYVTGPHGYMVARLKELAA